MGSEVVVIPVLFIGLPWLILHYVTQWKKTGSLTAEDETLLEELNDIARRLDDRVCTVERILAAENPNWRAVSCDPVRPALEDKADSTSPRRIQ